jgi:hypothetical protein
VELLGDIHRHGLQNPIVANELIHSWYLIRLCVETTGSRKEQHNMQYILVEAPDPDHLSTLVQRLLDEGWELYGNPMFAGFSTRPAVYAQALKNEHDKKQWTPTYVG